MHLGHEESLGPRRSFRKVRLQPLLEDIGRHHRCIATRLAAARRSCQLRITGTPVTSSDYHRIDRYAQSVRYTLGDLCVQTLAHVHTTGGHMYRTISVCTDMGAVLVEVGTYEELRHSYGDALLCPLVRLVVLINSHLPLLILRRLLKFVPHLGQRVVKDFGAKLKTLGAGLITSLVQIHLDHFVDVLAHYFRDVVHHHTLQDRSLHRSRSTHGGRCSLIRQAHLVCGLEPARKIKNAIQIGVHQNG
mmetsp:Transcript_19621/g.52291  ORF Transcript_19621/g.52291 Transcript_19621/m.52291 type:complete len:247 (+) Transcript_19621:755-1495(+)